MVQSKTKPSLLTKFLTIIIWLLTLLLSIVVVTTILDILLLIATYFISRSDNIPLLRANNILATVRNFWMLFGGAFWIAFLIGGSEYHLRRLGQPKSRRILFWTLGIELGFLVVSLFV